MLDFQGFLICTVGKTAVQGMVVVANEGDGVVGAEGGEEEPAMMFMLSVCIDSSVGSKLISDMMVESVIVSSFAFVLLVSATGSASFGARGLGSESDIPFIPPPFAFVATGETTDEEGLGGICVFISASSSIQSLLSSVSAS